MTDLLSFLARDPSLSLAFNYASLLLNTSFFLEGLVKDASAVQEVPGKFQGLEDQLVAQARGMVGSGWLWVSPRSCQFRPTFKSC
jgi:Fe-Mn family superoxide dismutase